MQYWFEERNYILKKVYKHSLNSRPEGQGSLFTSHFIFPTLTYGHERKDESANTRGWDEFRYERGRGAQKSKQSSK